jgi:hypothetical protein
MKVSFNLSLFDFAHRLPLRHPYACKECQRLAFVQREPLTDSWNTNKNVCQSYNQSGGKQPWSEIAYKSLFRFNDSVSSCRMASGLDGGSSCSVAQASAASSNATGNRRTAVGADLGLPIILLLFVTQSACFVMRVTVTESRTGSKAATSLLALTKTQVSETCTMANAALITNPVPATTARVGLFHGNLIRQLVLEKTRTSHSLWTGLYDAASHHFWKAKVAKGEARPSYFGSLKIIVKQEVATAAYVAECAMEHAARLDAARHATPADKIRCEIQCLDMADFHTTANRAEVRRLQAKLAEPTRPIA